MDESASFSNLMLDFLYLLGLGVLMWLIYELYSRAHAHTTAVVGRYVHWFQTPEAGS